VGTAVDDATDAGALTSGWGEFSGASVLVSIADGSGDLVTIAGRSGKVDEARAVDPDAEGGGDTGRAAGDGVEAAATRVSASACSVRRSGAGAGVGATVAGRDPVAGASVMFCRPTSDVRVGTPGSGCTMPGWL
jgi:hypothetical protein